MNNTKIIFGICLFFIVVAVIYYFGFSSNVAPIDASESKGYKEEKLNQVNDTNLIQNTENTFAIELKAVETLTSPSGDNIETVSESERPTLEQSSLKVEMEQLNDFEKVLSMNAEDKLQYFKTNLESADNLQEKIFLASMLNEADASPEVNQLSEKLIEQYLVEAAEYKKNPKSSDYLTHLSVNYLRSAESDEKVAQAVRDVVKSSIIDADKSSFIQRALSARPALQKTLFNEFKNTKYALPAPLPEK